jgi:hypothetical protein
MTSEPLATLANLVQAGWKFTPTYVDGDLEQLSGVRTWPGSDWSDGLMVLSPTDAKALRTDPAGGVVWQRTGTVTEVGEALLDLPHPDAPGAPRLVKATVPRLWTP